MKRIELDLMGFGLLVSALTLLVLWRYFHNQSQSDSLRIIVDQSDPRPTE